MKENLDVLHAMSDALMKYETIDASQIDQLMERKEVSPPKDCNDDDGAKPSADDKTSEKKKDDKGDGSIGGPASLH